MEIRTGHSDSFEAHRSRLFGLAYRMTGSVADAEDIVQETGIKWLTQRPELVSSPEAWLVKVATRLSLDHLKQFRVKRRAYVGPWLPEPLLMDSNHPEKVMALDETVTMALMIVLDRLSPEERAAYILHDLFRFSFAEVSELIEKSHENCRKLASRARKKIASSQVDPNPCVEDFHHLIPAFLVAIKNGELTELSKVLRQDVVFHADGGGKAAASPDILQGFEHVSDFVLRVLHPVFKRLDSAKVNAERVWFNGCPGIVLRLGGKPVTAFSFSIKMKRIQGIYAVRNPDKLQAFPRI